MAARAAHRLVTYNLLAYRLGLPSTFVYTDPALLEMEARAAALKRRLEPAVRAGAIIGLQELGVEWVEQLSPFFAEHRYALLTERYGKPHNGFMGVSLAVPTNRYEVEVCRHRRIADELEQFAPRRRPDPATASTAQAVFDGIMGFAKREFPRAVQDGLRAVGETIGLQVVGRDDPWATARGRGNAAVYAALRCRSSGSRFAVATYHMPCVFWNPPVMTLHAWAVAEAVRRWAAADGGLPYALMGDFNIQPSQPQYTLLTTGSLPETPEGRGADPTAVRSPLGSPDLAACTLPAPLTSAYAAVHGAEPELTNWARTRFTERSATLAPASSTAADGAAPAAASVAAGSFVGALDYVFLSEGLRATSATAIPGLAEADGPFPSPSEPSDHVPLEVEVEVEAPASTATPAASAGPGAV